MNTNDQSNNLAADFSCLVFVNDPGHAWLAVERKALLASGVAAKISRFSYQKDDTVYLEEDCDAPLYLKSLPCSPTLVDKHTNSASPIRDYARFSLTEGEC
jgi:hypothetical protein